ncbi:MAG: helix-turn-helix transcriptional regulator [Myxococcota bacterium]
MSSFRSALWVAEQLPLRAQRIAAALAANPQPSEATSLLVRAFFATLAAPSERDGRSQRISERAIAIVEHDLERWLSVSELSRALGLSRATFARRFREEVGEPPNRFFTKLRLERAAELLWTTDASMAQISAEVGFSTEFALSRAFKRRYGVSPSVYRRTRASGPSEIKLAA